MGKGIHDTLVYRLSHMLIKLNQGDGLDPLSLADEFGVSLRTIQRDINVRFAYLPLQKYNGCYFLDSAFLGKLNNNDIRSFAELAGVRGLFPSFSDDFLRDIFDSRMQSAFLVKGHHYENLTGKERLFQQLEKVIIDCRRISFQYRKEFEEKRYSGIESYKLLNHKGIWYLAANDGDILKTFSFSKIRSLRIEESIFTPDPEALERLEKEDGIWFGDDKLEVIMTVSGEVAAYFKRRKLIANQVVEKELDDGGLILSAKVGHANQILPILRYWIPHIRIVSPSNLQSEMESGLTDYLNN